MEFDIKVQNLAMIYILLNLAVTSTKEVDKLFMVPFTDLRITLNRCLLAVYQQ
jgi:hypothetical protein